MPQLVGLTTPPQSPHNPRRQRQWDASNFTLPPGRGCKGPSREHAAERPDDRAAHVDKEHQGTMQSQGQLLALLLLPAAAAAAACQLTESGPVTAKTDGQVIEYLSITTNATTPGIMVQGRKNVVIRNCRIQHHAQTAYPYGNGIYFTKADNLTIDHVDLSTCPGATVSQFVAEHFVAENMRGPYPRGQCFQCTNSDNVVVEDFYCRNDNTSWTEDNLSLFRSSNVTVRRGLIDGNDAPNGVGVMFEQDDPTKHGGLCEDVDAVHMGDGCFSTYGGKGIRFVRARCRDNHCAGWAGRDKPASGGVNSSGIRIEQSSYYAAWAFVEKDLSEVDFALRSPVSVSFCWEA
eukprot:gene35018-36794_t